MPQRNDTTTLDLNLDEGCVLPATTPFLDEREALEALLLVRAHDALRALASWLLAFRRVPVDGLEGELGDGRPFRIAKIGRTCAVWVYPDRAALDAHDACRAERPFASRDLRYLYAAQCPFEAMEDHVADALIEAGVDVAIDGGVVVRRCVSFGESVALRPADLIELCEVLGLLIARSRATAMAA